MGRAWTAVLRFRLPLIVLLHACLAAASLWSAYQIRFEFAVPPAVAHDFAHLVPLFIGSALVCLWAFGLFGGMWRYVTASDVEVLFKASAFTVLLFLLLKFLLYRGETLPRSVVLLTFLLFFLSTGGIRVATRRIRERFSLTAHTGNEKRLLILGAGDAGAMIAKDVLTHGAGTFEVVGFLDDDPNKQGLSLLGLTVLGPVSSLPDVVARHQVTEIFIAMPSASGADMRRIMDVCETVSLKPKTLPSVADLLDGTVNLSHLRDVSVEDLLKRKPVTLEEPLIAGALRGRRVLVTGAGGSIGSELCRQIASRGPAALILLERSEPALYEIHLELCATNPGLDLVPLAGDIRDEDYLETMFLRHRPEVVFHAAAYKHVPMMEQNPCEAVINNVLGSKKVANVATHTGVERFVQISTDKAINPTSVMGATKRIAELFIQELAQRSHCKFMTVRFGNVLGSVGSVVPLFKRQIAAGGPVTVTHPDMRRYFMTIPEACQLVLQAATMGKGGEIFVLDMGEPVKILDLATDLIRLSGHTPGKDIEITFTGLRPGEKLFEEILTSGEAAQPTHHPSIVVARPERRPFDELNKAIVHLGRLADVRDATAVRDQIKVLVPEYQPAVDAPAPAVG